MKLLIILLTLSFFSNISYGRSPLNLRKFLELYQKTDPNYKSINLELEQLQYFIDQNSTSPKAILTLSGEKGIDTGTREDATLLTGSIKKSILQTGTSFAISHTKIKNMDRQEDLTQIRVEQSLLQNSFGKRYRRQITLLENDQEIKKLELLEKKELYISTTINQILQLNKAFKDFKLAEKIYNESTKLNKNIKSKLKSNIATTTDYNRSELQTLINKETLITKKNAYDSLKQSISQIINIDEFDLSSNVTEYLISKFEKHIDYKALKNTDHLRERKIKKLKEKNAKNNVKLVDEENTPKINLILGYDIDDSTRFSSVSNKKETVMGLNFEIPLGDTQASANSSIAKVELLNSENESHKSLLNIKRDIYDQKLQLELVKTQLDIQKRKVILSKNILQDEEKRYSIGKISTNRLIETKNTYATYRILYEQQLLDYAQALVNWHTKTDSLLIVKDLL